APDRAATGATATVGEEILGSGEAALQAERKVAPAGAVEELDRQAEGKVATDDGVALGGDEDHQGCEAPGALGAGTGEIGARAAALDADTVAVALRFGDPDRLTGLFGAAEIDAYDALSHRAPGEAVRRPPRALRGGLPAGRHGTGGARSAARGHGAGKRDRPSRPASPASRRPGRRFPSRPRRRRRGSGRALLRPWR